MAGFRPVLLSSSRVRAQGLHLRNSCLRARGLRGEDYCFPQECIENREGALGSPVEPGLGVEVSRRKTFNIQTLDGSSTPKNKKSRREPGRNSLQNKFYHTNNRLVKNKISCRLPRGICFYISYYSAPPQESARHVRLGKLAVKPHLYSTNYFAAPILILQRLIYPTFDRRLSGTGEGRRSGGS